MDIINGSYGIFDVMINDGAYYFSHNFKINECSQGANAVLDVNKNGNPDLFINSHLYLDVKDGSFDRVVSFKEKDLVGVSSINYNRCQQSGSSFHCCQ